MFSNDLFITHFEKFALCFTVESEFLTECIHELWIIKEISSQFVCKSMQQYWSIFSSSNEKFKQDCIYQINKRESGEFWNESSAWNRQFQFLDNISF